MPQALVENWYLNKHEIDHTIGKEDIERYYKCSTYLEQLKNG